MSVRPLRPDTDLRLGKPLPYQLANQPRPPPQAHFCFDLAMLCGISPGFPELFPTRGQVVTCYSPGRHFTHGLLHFLVRLACVRHAASVDSEPGSNSRLKPDAYRRVEGRLPSPASKAGMAPPFSLHPPPKRRAKFTVVYLVRSSRTYARIRSLTTGTFNRVVKDRIAFRLSGAPSGLDGLFNVGEPTV